MLLAITGQWVAEMTTVLCLFGAACIGLAMTAGETGTTRQVEQKAVERHPAAARREIPKPDNE